MIENQRVAQGAFAKEPASQPTRPNDETHTYIFEGWYISTDNGTTFAEKPFDFKNTPITDNITLFAKWTINLSYYVTFNLNGAGGVIGSQLVAEGKKAIKPADPTRNGDETHTYVFDGWYESEGATTVISDTPFDFENTPITHTTYLVAKWTVTESFYVSFNTNGGKGSFTNQKVQAGKTAIEPETAPTKETDTEAGYEFAGWFTSTNGGQTLATEPFDFNTAITDNLTLYAGWTLIPYVTVTFNVNGGKGEYEEQRILKGKTITKPATNPTKDSDEEHTYSFVNWFISTDEGKTFASEPFDFSQPIAGNIELYAVWTTKEICTVTFDYNGGEGTNFDENVIVGEKVSAPAATPERKSDEDYDYTFAGWFTSDDEGKTLSSTPFNFDKAITDNITLYAGWTRTAYYHVTFITNGGNESIDSQRIKSGKKAQEPATSPTKDSTETDSYEFAGWFTSDDEGKTLSANPFDFNTPITESITLYAKWRTSSAAAFEVEIDFTESTDIKVTKTVNEDDGTITFEADPVFSSYEWKWDGKVQSSNTNTLTVEMPKTPGVYRLLLIVDKERDEPHSQTMEVTIR